jgi:hypothetical protein
MEILERYFKSSKSSQHDDQNKGLENDFFDEILPSDIADVKEVYSFNNDIIDSLSDMGDTRESSGSIDFLISTIKTEPKYEELSLFSEPNEFVNIFSNFKSENQKRIRYHRIAPIYIVDNDNHGRKCKFKSVKLLVDNMSLEEKKERRKKILEKYLIKRKNRTFKKIVRYQKRKDYADQRPRSRGRFVKNSSLNESSDMCSSSSLEL